MYYASRNQNRQKRRSAVSVVPVGGEAFEGHFFVFGIERISDLLNGEQEFIPFENSDGRISILNRGEISRVMPREDQDDPSAKAHYAHTQAEVEKRKSAVSLFTTAGEAFEGHFFVSGRERISDVLNRRSRFVPFQDLDGVVHIFSRRVIVRVVPQETTGGAPAGIYYAEVPNKATKRKVQVSLIMANDQEFEGHIFVSDVERISDLLNRENEFVPFEDLDGTIHIFNRRAMRRMDPEQDGKADSKTDPGPDQIDQAAAPAQKPPPSQGVEDRPEDVAELEAGQDLGGETASEPAPVESPTATAEAESSALASKATTAFQRLDDAATAETGPARGRHGNREFAKTRDLLGADGGGRWKSTKIMAIGGVGAALLVITILLSVWLFAE